MDYKRITLLAGHYGSGKTNIAVNMALDMRKKYEKCGIADLDIVNPYFRTKDSRDELSAAGIRLIASEYANTNLDIPALPQDMYAVTDEKDTHFIIDVGGDDRGALALGRLTPAILSENDYEMLMVINCYRPLTPDAESVLEVMREIEAAGGIRFTGLVNNSNLASGTEAADVLHSLDFADRVSGLTGLPLVLTTCEDRLYGELQGKIHDLFPLHLQKRPV